MNNSVALSGPAPSEEEMSLFHRAAMHGNSDIVANFIDKYPSAIDVEDAGWTALGWAVCNGQRDIVEMLLEKGADIENGCSGRGMAPLIYAALFGQTEIAQLLLAKGAAVDGRSHNGWTPLMFAAQGGKSEAVTVLLEHGALAGNKSEGVDAGQTAADIAYNNGHDDVVELLQQHVLEQKRKKEEEKVQWLKTTDCSLGLPRAIPVRPPLKVPRPKI